MAVAILNVIQSHLYFSVSLFTDVNLAAVIHTSDQCHKQNGCWKIPLNRFAIVGGIWHGMVPIYEKGYLVAAPILFSFQLPVCTLVRYIYIYIIYIYI